MRYVTFGRTGLRVSVMGLGCGGHSRLGTSYGHSEAEAAAVVRKAVDLGVNLIDTAENYQTEPAVGRALREVGRHGLVLSTKTAIHKDGRLVSAADLRAACEQSLQRLGTDCIDVYNLHAVRPEDYGHARAEHVPELLKLREEGKIRFLGITEFFNIDTGHEMLQHALSEDLWDVAMVGFSLLNPSARTRVFPLTRKYNVAVQIMFAVRRALSRPDALRELLAQLAERDEVPAALVGEDGAPGPLDFLMDDHYAGSIPEAAYRFCLFEPGVHSVLTGTGDVHHLQENLRAADMPPLPERALHRLAELFGHVDSVSGN